MFYANRPDSVDRGVVRIDREMDRDLESLGDREGMTFAFETIGIFEDRAEEGGVHREGVPWRTHLRQVQDAPRLNRSARVLWYAAWIMGETGLRIERRGATAILTLDREATHNALDRTLVRAIGSAAREAGDDASVRSVVITGAGDKAFCAGADLRERRAMSVDEIRDMLALYKTEFGAVDRCPKPVIAAINGAAFGGGLELALACDLRVVAEHARLGLTEVSLAIIPGAGGTQRLTRLVGEAKAKELILLARRIDATEALGIGIVHRIAPSGETALEAALEWATTFESAAPIAMSAALEAIDASVDLPLDAGLAFETRAYERTLVSSDRIEALDAFLGKRTPTFSGT